MHHPVIQHHYARHTGYLQSLTIHLPHIPQLHPHSSQRHRLLRFKVIHTPNAATISVASPDTG